MLMTSDDAIRLWVRLQHYKYGCGYVCSTTNTAVGTFAAGQTRRFLVISSAGNVLPSCTSARYRALGIELMEKKQAMTVKKGITMDKTQRYWEGKRWVRLHAACWADFDLGNLAIQWEKI